MVSHDKMKEVHIHIPYLYYTLGKELDEAQQTLLRIAQEASKYANAPYSGFYVGAAILLQDGTIIQGCNQENSSYPCGICAERAVLATYGNLYSKIKIIKMAISSQSEIEHKKSPAAPCGFCRQVMTEFELQNGENIQLILGHLEKVTYVFSSIGSLLPLAFNKEYLLKL